MIYFLATILFLAFWALCDVITENNEQSKIQKKRKFNIPKEFWDDYNRAMYCVERMGINEVNKCQYMIDDIIFKYHECLDYNTFTEKIGMLIIKIESKKKVFLLNTQLN
jgi:hypothetical protein